MVTQGVLVQELVGFVRGEATFQQLRSQVNLEGHYRQRPRRFQIFVMVRIRERRDNATEREVYSRSEDVLPIPTRLPAQLRSNEGSVVRYQHV
ncbi:hypothetical protein D3C87_1517740 [compost metagenome]